MTDKAFIKARELQREMMEYAQLHKEIVINIDNLFKKTYGADKAKEPFGRLLLRKISDEILPIIEKEFQERIDLLEKQFKEI